MDEKTILSVKNLTVEFNEALVLNDISFSIKKGEVFVIIGPNGAGKTILFKALLGLIPYKGEISWRKNIRIGYVPQKFNVGRDFPLTVEEFLQLTPPKNSREQLFEALKFVGFVPLRGISRNETESRHHGKSHLEHHILNRKIGLLSAGESQRILIAAAILDKPDVLLFDEPTSGIDISSEEIIYENLKKINQKENFTLLLISHDLSVVHRWATNVLCLNHETICLGKPYMAIESDVLKKLYGTERAFYKHEHKD